MRRTLPSMVFLLAASPLAGAQQQNVDEIVVTATRTGETRLSETPIAITVFDETGLQVRGIEEIEDLARYTPGLKISENTNLAQIYIRGIGTNNVFAGSDPSTPIHLDGVYISRPLASVFDMLNVERIEVLKGPQGTLYGRNATGGTINIITKLPDQRVDNWLSVDVGKFDKRRFKLHTSGPLVDNRLAGNFELLRHDRDGFVDNRSAAGQDPLSDEHRTGFAGTLRWFLADNAEFIFKGDRYEADETGTSFKSTFRSTAGTPGLGAPSKAGHFHEVTVPFGPELETTSYGLSGKLVIDLADNLTFTSLTAYRDLDAYAIADVDWTDSAISQVSDLTEDQEQWSQEFQLNGTHGNMKWLAGLYYFHEDHHSVLRPNNPANSFDTVSKSTSWAIFGESSWALTDKLSGTLGARFNYDHKDYNNNANFVVTLPALAFTGTFDDDQSWRSFMPKYGLDYQIDDNTMAYATISRGYKSGGYNPTTNPANADPEFDPEWVTAYELGLKESSRDRKLNLNTSLFYYDYTDIQVQSFQGAGAVVISNVDEAEVFGAEIESVWNPSASWQLDLNLAWLHAQYLDDATAQRAGGVVVPIDGNTLNVAPEWTANLAVNYFSYLPQGTVHYRLDYYRQTQEYYSAFNDDINSQPAYDVTSARVSYLTQDEQWEVSLYGDNLTNSDYASAGTDFALAGVTRSINAPRTYGLQVIWRGL